MSDQVVEKKSETKKQPKQEKYRLVIYDSVGHIRADISKNTFYNLNGKFGDVIRSVSIDKFDFVEEIHETHRKNVKRLGYLRERTLEEIRGIVQTLLEAGFVIRK